MADKDDLAKQRGKLVRARIRSEMTDDAMRTFAASAAAYYLKLVELGVPDEAATALTSTLITAFVIDIKMKPPDGEEWKKGDKDDG